MQQVDVAIVGGGPAGSSAAYEAAVQGAETVVLEKGVPRADREGLGPDSTDAAGMLDYWVDIMDFRPEEIPDEVILSDLEGASFIGPNESVTIRDTGIDATYPEFGFAFHRARFDDWLRERAESAGATYRIGTSVSDVTTDMTGGHTHEIERSDGENVQARYLILADGPQRTVTTDAVDQFLPHDHSVRDYLDSNIANHIAYQEHRKVPEELFDEGLLKFWWGVMPGHTAYPWIFPNDNNVARIGLTMPIGMDLADVENPQNYALLDPDDEQIPPGRVYIRRLLEREYPEYDIEEDFPLVEDRGKRKGTEAYPISSTRPIESPTEAGVAVVGGAMGATSAFHEGGDHVAVRTGKIAGQLAGQGRLDRYNREWKRAIGEEVRRNVSLADMVRGWNPDDWDDTFRLVDNMLNRGEYSPSQALGSGLSGIRLVAEYKLRKLSLGSGRYVQLRQNDYLF
ncbi:electron-transferring-flavoprotein dehydrogenase [Halorientalis persicus]|jgi:electron-transferring-flavoprotein dehydrogenase|uniref:Electron-transferring-flavoprotein dehydrogenase n=1 Tax=Halorientalis persicus TaxID=1367881 RepID=A0A1H8JLD4_9EURY|nr:NAD(P)/FAD-dependent oxidoreductase [Halorientalis persicus]SEN81355.1 electron-transferring-flavoprotein dehydrogenase [Halorientalis persicus]